MHVVLVRWRARPGQEEALEDLLVRQSRNSLALETGCRQFDVALDGTDSGDFVLYEVYDDATAFEAHKAMPHFASFSAAAAPITMSKQVRILTRIEGHRL